MADSSRARSLSAVKSLLTFGQRIGYLVYNVGAAVLLPKTKSTLAGRILDRETVIRMIALETAPRNQAMLALAYDAGVRVSELVSITGADLVKRENGTAQITVFGKGNQTRVVLIGPEDVQRMQKFVPADPTHPLFRSRSGRPLDQSMLWRIVRKADRRASIDANVSTHWLRHACASHSLDAGAPVHLVRAQLGHASLETTTRYRHARPDDGLFRYRGIDWSLLDRELDASSAEI